MKVAFFGYAWNRTLQPDAYMAETIASLAAAGADVDFYLGSQLTKEYGIYGLNPAVHLERLIQFIRVEAYDAAVSFTPAPDLLPGPDLLSGPASAGLAGIPPAPGYPPELIGHADITLCKHERRHGHRAGRMDVCEY